MYSVVQALKNLRLTIWLPLHFLIHCSNNSLFKLTVGTLRTDLSEFQGQNFKVGGTLEAELVSFCIQGCAKILHRRKVIGIKRSIRRGNLYIFFRFVMGISLYNYQDQERKVLNIRSCLSSLS